MATHYKGTRDEIRALNAFINVNRAADSLGGRLSGSQARAGLPGSQFGALEALYHLGPLNQRELGEKLLRSGGNITLVVDNLEKRGLVRRERQTDDRRCIRVSLTDEGRRLIARIFPRHVAAILTEMSILTPAEQETLARLCRKLGKQERD